MNTLEKAIAELKEHEINYVYDTVNNFPSGLIPVSVAIDILEKTVLQILNYELQNIN